MLIFSSCSPAYVAQSAAGHADLLIRRRSIAGALKDRRTPPTLRAQLETAQSARGFAFERMGLQSSRDYSSYVMIDRPAVTWLVSASRRTSLEPYEWRFPLAGRFPYKGHFAKTRALAERDRLEGSGWDACVSGAAAYNTPLPLSDPLPSSALSLSTGALAALLVHELSHGTLRSVDMSFNEAACEFLGRRGAEQYLAERFGGDSAELADYRRELAQDRAIDEAFLRLRARLAALYAEPAADAEKLARRQPIFDEAGTELRKLGVLLERLNNAVVTTHRVYHDDLPFAALLERCGGDWRRFVAALKDLDSKRPAAALREAMSR